MRLTLRALLAYLYNVLDPADASEFSTKVQESAVASGLVQRIGAITKKMRMNAPRIDAKGMADDANNVAEYLDNSLPDEQVADFERACINSDMHLAEVASSYQILTMVLGKAADVPDALQTRVDRLPLDLATTHKDHAGDGKDRKRLKKTIEKVAHSSREAAAGPHAVRTGSTHPVPQVPDYLRGGSEAGRMVRWLAIAAAVAILALVGIRAAGPFDATNGVIGWMFTPEREVADAGLPVDAGDSGTVVDAGAAADGDSGSSKDATDEDAIGSARPSDERSESGKDADQAAEKAAHAKVADLDPSPGPPIPPEPPVEPEPATSAEGSDTKGTTKVEAAATDARPAAVDPMDVGRYVSDDQLLARFDLTSELWFLTPPRAILNAGEHLVVLPTYRPQIALASGVQVTFAGESEVRLDEPVNAGASRISVEYGRFLIVTLGNAGAQIELDFHGVQGLLTLEDSDTVVAVDVRHFLPPGSSLDMDERVRAIEIFASNGKIRWEETGLDPVDIPAAQALTYMSGQERELAGPLAPPQWMNAESVPHIDRLTSRNLQRELAIDRPVQVQLRELMSDRRAEVRGLASRCLAQLGEFEPLVRELGNSQQKAFWAGEVDMLRHSLTRSTEAQALIRRSLDSLYPRDADTLFRLLIGFSPEQLEAEGAQTLVEALDSPEMAVRVVAIDTLRLITDEQLLYRPEKAPADNRVSINRWLERAKDGSIVYKVEPSPLSHRKLSDPPPSAEGKAAPAKAKAEPAKEEPAEEKTADESTKEE